TALSNNDTSTVEHCLTVNKVSPNIRNKELNTGLHLAVVAQNKDLLKLLLKHNADISLKNRKGLTAIQLAAEIEAWECYQLIADYGSKREISNNNNFMEIDEPKITKKVSPREAYKEAVQQGNIAEIAQLLAAKVSVNTVVDAQLNTLLHVGVKTQNLELIRLALQNGAVSNRKNKQGKTPLELALENKAWSCIKTIVENDPVHNESLDAALLAALRAHKVELVHDLIHAGASMHYFTTLPGKLYFEKLVATKQDEMLAVLSISPVIQELMYLVAISNNDIFAVEGALSRKDITVDALLGPNKETGLHTAITNKRADMVKLFLNNHIQLNARDINQLTAIELALKLQSWDLIKIILEKRPLDKSNMAQYQLVLMHALKANQPDILMILLGQGMQVLPSYFNTDEGVQDYQRMVANQWNDMIHVLLRGSKEFRMKFGVLPNEVKDYFEEIIMGEELTNPVITMQGTTYNAQDIKRLVSDPITRAPLQQSELVPNLIVYDLLAYYKHPNVNLMEVPPCLICPETNDVYKEPVVAGDGITYEKAWITDYLQKNKNKTPGGHPQLDRPLYKNRLVKTLVDEKYSLEKMMEEKNRENYKKAFAERNLKAVEESLKAKVSPNTPLDANANTGLHKAVEDGSIELIKLLLDHGASLTMLNKSGLSPMKLAVTRKAWNCIGAIATLHPNDKTMLSQYDIPLIHALQADQIEVARALLKAGAPMSYFTLEEGEEYFKQLIETQQKEILTFLITEGRPEVINPLLFKFGKLASVVEELFEDSISFTPIEVPVIVPTGITYDIQTATDLKMDPLSRQPLTKEDLIPNLLVKDLLTYYKRPGVNVSQLPPCLICKETNEIFKNPTVAVDGKTYEEAWITQYLADHNGMTPPADGAPKGLKQTKNLYSNILVKKVIEEHYKNELQKPPAKKMNFSGESNPGLFGNRGEKKEPPQLDNYIEYNYG
ncbi:ankyrin repeat domain-containing protein, partial [Legionella anisa]|uniref:ankyrin repeat domain-containing protein n=1 Tax=Legionella anisa TaxID=28082 RepID=UPI001980D827